jgi:hypothetical protein
MNGETGGSFWHNWSDSGADIDRSVSVSFPSTAGDTIWMAALINPKGTGDAGIFFDGPETVDGAGFKIGSGGTVYFTVSDNGGTDADHDTGIAAAVDTTHFLLARLTYGAGSSSNRQSTAEIWVDPTDASSVAALGTADFSTGADSKWGRGTGWTSLRVDADAQSRVDEIRVGEDLIDVVGIPEPTTLGLLGLGGLAMLRRRRA